MSGRACVCCRDKSGAARDSILVDRDDQGRSLREPLVKSPRHRPRPARSCVPPSSAGEIRDPPGDGTLIGRKNRPPLHPWPVCSSPGEICGFNRTGQSAASITPDGSRAAAAETTFTLHGTLVHGRLTGVIDPLGLAFATNVLPPAGPSAAYAGFYRSSTLGTVDGATYSIVGPQNQVLVVASTPALTTSGVTTLNANGTFSLQTTTTAGLATVDGAIDAPTTTITGTLTLPGQSPAAFAGTNIATLRTDRLVNLSSRARVSPAGDRTLITGFVIGGTAPKRVLMRAIGPALAGFGLSEVLNDPRLVLYNAAGSIVGQNDDCDAADLPAMAACGAFALAPGCKDAALVTTLAPGGYTLHVLDGGETGVALAEIYDASVNPENEYQRLVNISTRGTVETGAGVLIGGFVITGNSPKKVLIRGVGPTLAGFGVASALADPRLAVYHAETVIAQNDNWSTVATDATALASAAQATGAFVLPADSKDAALILTIAPGVYTAQVSAADGGTGVALVEIYEIPE